MSLEQRSENKQETTRHKVWVNGPRHCGKVSSQYHVTQSGASSWCFLLAEGGQTPQFLTWHSGPFLAWSVPKTPSPQVSPYKVYHKSRLIGPGVEGTTLSGLPHHCAPPHPTTDHIGLLLYVTGPLPHTGHTEQSLCSWSPKQSQECESSRRKQLETPSEGLDSGLRHKGGLPEEVIQDSE